MTKSSRRAFRRIGFYSLVVMLMLSAGGARAVPLQDLFDGATLTAGGLTFSDWQLDFVDPIGPPPDLSLIEVLLLEDDPLNPGVEYMANGQLAAAGLDVVELAFTFRVDTPGGLPEIKDNSLSLDAFEHQQGGGAINIFEDVLTTTSLLIGEKNVVADEFFGVFDLEDSAEFAPQSVLLIGMFLTVAGDGFPGVVSLDSFSQRFSVVSPVRAPEPGTLGLLLFGLFAATARGFTRGI